MWGASTEEGRSWKAGGGGRWNGWICGWEPSRCTEVNKDVGTCSLESNVTFERIVCIIKVLSVESQDLKDRKSLQRNKWCCFVFPLWWRPNDPQHDSTNRCCRGWKVLLYVSHQSPSLLMRMFQWPHHLHSAGERRGGGGLHDAGGRSVGSGVRWVWVQI